MNRKTFDGMIPRPQRVEPLAGVLELKSVLVADLAAAPGVARRELAALAAYYGLRLVADGTAEATAEATVLRVRRDPGAAPAAWELEITSGGMVIAGDAAGIYHAVNALAQMFAVAFRCGGAPAVLDGVKISDAPRFAWRGFMLDSARHFQSVATIKAVLKLMAMNRLNVFHWHLTDDQGWRFPSATAAKMAAVKSASPGCYSAADIREVTEFAKAHFIEVVPEMDVPGHSQLLLAAYPELGCVPGAKEYCIGAPKVRQFVKTMLGELMALFPESRYIHLGGDEAEVANWQECPCCRPAARQVEPPTVRGLEHDFMLELVGTVAAAGKTPIVWGIGSELSWPVNVMVQAWLDIREPLKLAAHGNRVIYSVHNSLYFDYPENPAEPHESWMFALDSAGVHMTDPYMIWPEKVRDAIAGVEACLWTETVPEWRVLTKMLSRMAAYSEVAWCEPENKDYDEMTTRKKYREAAGFEQYVQTVIERARRDERVDCF